MAIKGVAWKSSKRNYAVTTWRKKVEGKTIANLERFANHILVIPENDEVESGREITNSERILWMRKANHQNLCHEVGDLEAENDRMNQQEKEIIRLKRELASMQKKQAQEGSGETTKVSRAGNG